MNPVVHGSRLLLRQVLRRSPLLVLLAGVLACSTSDGSERNAVASATSNSASNSTAGPDLEIDENTPIVLISIDTLRSDRLPAYGYEGVATPAIDALRAQSILFERAYSHMALTLPSHTSIFTGLWPVDHGVRDNIGYKMGGDIATLPELLQDEGYATLGAVSAYVLRASTGIARGFDQYDDGIKVTSGTELGSLQRSGLETLAAASRLLEANKNSDKPPFLFFHIYEPHTPNDPPEPFRSRYPSPYDAEVAEADLVIGRLVAELQRLELYDEALVILLSDHGEGLDDHGEYEHEVLIYREVIQVPLLVKLPGGQRGGTTIGEPAQLVDILPTILDLLAIETPASSSPKPMRGDSLFRLRDRDRLIFSESVYPRIHFGWSDLASIVDGKYHYIQSPNPELFDLLEDPGETNNILQQERSVSRRLAAALEEIDRELQPPAAVDEETMARLLTLGYVGGSSARSGDLPDPKSKLGVLEDLGEAARAMTSGDLETAAVKYRAVAQADPGMVYAWEQLGKTLRQAGDLAGAIDAYQKALKASPTGGGSAALSLAEIFLELGQQEQAKEHAEIAAVTHDAAYDLLAQLALAEGDLATASKNSNVAIQRRSGRIEPLVTRVSVLLAQKRYQEAIDAAAVVDREFRGRTDQAVLAGLDLQRGKALAELGRRDDAEAAFRRELERSPKELAPYTHLSLLQALNGNFNGAVGTLRSMVEANDRPEAYAEAAATLRILGNPEDADALLRSARQRFPNAEALRGR